MNEISVQNLQSYLNRLSRVLSKYLNAIQNKICFFISEINWQDIFHSTIIFEINCNPKQ